jgi:hypothetical protein
VAIQRCEVLVLKRTVPARIYIGKGHRVTEQNGVFSFSIYVSCFDLVLFSILPRSRDMDACRRRKKVGCCSPWARGRGGATEEVAGDEEEKRQGLDEGGAADLGVSSLVTTSRT